MNFTLANCIDQFKIKFGTPEVELCAPGRANIIGEHTDYNQGFVLPFGIDKYINFVASKSSSSISTIYAINFHEKVEIDLTQNYKGFSKFLAACLMLLREETNQDFSVNLVFGGDLPIGAGISSSSALCCGFLETLSRLYQLNLSAEELLRLAITVERGAGVEGGIMDQFTIINAKANHAIFLDCLDNSVEQIPFTFNEYSFVIFDTAVEHNLEDTAYNDRVNTCRSALTTIQSIDSSVQNFRMIKPNHLQLLNGKEKNRIEHVLLENQRLLKAKAFLKAGNAIELGRLLIQSHFSLRDLYEVSCNELNFVVDFLELQDHVAGARMMGGGFGGSVIALVKKNKLAFFAQELINKYNSKFDIDLRYFEVSPSDGLIERRKIGTSN